MKRECLYSKSVVRDYLGKGLIEAGKIHPEVYVLTAELKKPTRCNMFEDVFPERFQDVGIAEQNLFGIGAGLASCGKIPFLVSYANFACLRAGEQIRNDISYTNFNAKVVAMSTGLTFGTGGPTHQSYEDIGVMRAMPNFQVVVPADGRALKKAVLAAADHVGPVFIRSGRGEEYDVYSDNDCPFVIGKANILKEGHDVAIVACGFMVHEAQVAADILENNNISTKVVDMHTIKPIDTEVLNRIADECKLIVTVEEHYKINGLGTAVADTLAVRSHPPIVKIGLDDQYPPTGPVFELRKYLGLSAENIVKTVGEYIQ